MNYKTLLKLKALTTDTVLKTLEKAVELDKNSDHFIPPQISISTASGITHYGYFINYTATENSVLIAEKNTNMGVNYIHALNITSIYIHDIETYAHLFSDGEIAFVPTEKDTPTMLSLKKDINQLETAISGKLNKKIALKWEHQSEEISPADKYYAKKAMLLLEETLALIYADNLFKEALTENIGNLVFSSATNNQVRLIEKTLSLEINWKNPPLPNALFAMIEECF
ncbi:putative RNA-binding protein with RPS1 domain [Mesonia hippocampi]|uniref:Putative RNA-binding protein with RPS1 domain n=1 Tax=Mesonia hippocampi TaxID=1628250 RepID=A0A840EK24_9FLAO|nr:hypothetical protein [Mesonia hippocampi]MBB4118729.1 putative RNA-binding protein with RPS1 domain [Mesonia hippocampi]